MLYKEGEDDFVTKYKTGLCKVLRSKNSREYQDGGFYMNKGVFYDEFHFINNLLKTKVVKYNETKLVFLNRNIYSNFISTGLYK